MSKDSGPRMESVYMGMCVCMCVWVCGCVGDYMHTCGMCMCVCVYVCLYRTEYRARAGKREGTLEFLSSMGAW